MTLIGLLWGWKPAAALSVLVLVTVPFLWRATRSSRWGYGLLTALVIAGIASAGIAVRTHEIQHHPLRVAADHGARATVRVTLEKTPKPLSGGSYGARRAEDRAVVRATLHAVESAEGRTQVGGEVLLLVPTQQWRGLIAGQPLTVRGKVVPPRGGELLVAAIQVFAPPNEVLPAPTWQRTAEDLRSGLRRLCASVLSPREAGLLPGLVVGETSGIEPEVSREFRTAGLAHLTAVSGANLAIVCGAVLLVVRRIGAGPLVSAIGAGLALVGFVLLAGTEPSVLRAAVMGAVALLALAVGRERAVLPALSMAVIGLLLLAPDLASNVGFALSVSATAALILLAPSWSAALHARGIPVGIAEAIAVPAAAHVVTAPLVAAISGEVSVVAVAANLLVSPVVAPATVLGFSATVVAPVLPWLAEVLVWLAAPELKWVLAVAHHSAALPGAVVQWPSGSAGAVLLAGVVAVVLIGSRSRRIRWVLAALLVVAGLVVVPVRVLVPSWPVPGWSMVACDVGQGDGLVLATGEPATAVVVDTGPEPARTGECLRRLGIRHVPLVILTHLHADHVGGLSAVLDDRAVGAVATSGSREPGWAAAEIQREAARARLPLVRLFAGQQVRWPGLVLDVLGPTGSLARNPSSEDANDASVVLRATTPAGRILLTGDIELLGQSRLLASRVDLRADVLKIPHHGSRYTTPRFLAAVRPRWALVSVGDGNRYGHPSPLVTGALARAGARVMRTDHAGDLAVFPRPGGVDVVGRGDPIRADESS